MSVLRQFLFSHNADGRETRAWVADDPRLTVGRVVTLEHAGDECWTILERGTMTVTEPQRRTWRVGGICDR